MHYYHPSYSDEMQTACVYAKPLLEKGISRYELNKRLRKLGLDENEAREVYLDLLKEHTLSGSSEYRSKALVHITIAIVLCLIGFVIIVVNLRTTGNFPTGGEMIIAWSAILIGIWRFIKSLADLVA